MQQIQDFQRKPVQSVNYVSYNSRSKKSKKPSNEQNSSSSTGSTGSKRKCFQCREPYSKKHLEECKATNVKCNGCGIKGHFQKCCKKSGNFPKGDSNPQKQTSSTDSRGMNYAAAPTPLEADFFDEKGFPKEYRPTVQQQIGSMNVLRKIQVPSNATYISENGVEIQHNISTSVSNSVPVPIPSPDFPFQEFPLTEVVIQSQIDSSSISDTSHPRETVNSLSKATKRTDFPLKSVQSCSSDEEMREIGDPAVSAKHTQSTRDSYTISISDNSTPRKSIPGIKTDSLTALPVETNTDIPTEFVQNEQLSNNRSVTPFSSFSSKVLQVSIPDPTQSTSDDFQAKNSNSLQRKGDDDALQLIQKIHNQLQQVQWDLQRLHSLHKYKI